jgi:hypothetical protein
VPSEMPDTRSLNRSKPLCRSRRAYNNSLDLAGVIAWAMGLELQPRFELARFHLESVRGVRSPTTATTTAQHEKMVKVRHRPARHRDDFRGRRVLSSLPVV